MQALLKITGKVQGVFYRTNAKKQATQLNLTGYAKNLPDGSVESLVQGPQSQIQKYIEWCQQGPKSARVENVEVTRQNPKNPQKGFSIS